MTVLFLAVLSVLLLLALGPFGLVIALGLIAFAIVQRRAVASLNSATASVNAFAERQRVQRLSGAASAAAPSFEAEMIARMDRACAEAAERGAGAQQ